MSRWWQEETAAAREAAEAAAAWWRTREAKADGTLRQQAKLIDFLQVRCGSRPSSSTSCRYAAAAGRAHRLPAGTLRQQAELIDFLQVRCGSRPSSSTSCRYAAAAGRAHRLPAGTLRQQAELIDFLQVRCGSRPSSSTSCGYAAAAGRAHRLPAGTLRQQAELIDFLQVRCGSRPSSSTSCRYAAAAGRAHRLPAGTLRQQAELIDFLQVRCGSRSSSSTSCRYAAAPPCLLCGPRDRGRWHAAACTMELREEVDRLRAELAARNGENVCPVYAATPKREKPKTGVTVLKSIDSPDSPQDNSSVDVVWEDGGRDRMQCHCSEGALVLTSGDRRLRARYHGDDAKYLLQSEANKAFTVKMDDPARYSEAILVCNNIAARNELLRQLRSFGAASTGYSPAPACATRREPATALYVAANAIAIGCEDGLHSLRGAVSVEWESDGRPVEGGVSLAARCSGRVLLVCGGRALHAAELAAGSALRRAPALRPALTALPVPLPALPAAPPHLLQVCRTFLPVASAARLAPQLAAGSALRRAPALRPALTALPVPLPALPAAPPHLLQVCRTFLPVASAARLAPQLAAGSALRRAPALRPALTALPVPLPALPAAPPHLLQVCRTFLPVASAARLAPQLAAGSALRRAPALRPALTALPVPLPALPAAPPHLLQVCRTFLPVASAARLAPQLAAGSALRRAPALRPALTALPVPLPALPAAPPHLLQVCRTFLPVASAARLAPQLAAGSALRRAPALRPALTALPVPLPALPAAPPHLLQVCRTFLPVASAARLAPQLAAGSALRRAPALRPALTALPVPLPALPAAPPHLLQVCRTFLPVASAARLAPQLAAGSALRRAPTLPTISGVHSHENSCAVIACGRRVFLLKYDASHTDFKITRSFTVDRPPYSLLLTSGALYIAGDKPLKVLLPSGALEAFGMDEPILAAAARKSSPPRAILLIGENPTEILLCYAECGVFVNENGKRTRQEDPKWSSAVRNWQFVRPFLYLIGDDKITILHISDEVYRAPPCTCDTTSITSLTSECYSPEIFNLRIKGPTLLGSSPSGIIIGYKDEDDYKITLVEGVAAFRSVGASLESLVTVSESKGSSSDLCQSMSDLPSQDVSQVSQDSQESVEATTGFLADIQKKAKQLRNKSRKEQTCDDVIKQILTTEVGLKCSNTTRRKSPATTSEFDSDSTGSEDRTDSTKGSNEVCAEMFARQVRFNH
ncbi:hypothetical protein ACJJTC_006104 [Scirpophaga incertulas]